MTNHSLCFCFFNGQAKPLQLYLLLSKFWADVSFHDFLCLPERVHFIKLWLLTEHAVSPDSWDYKWQTTSQFHFTSGHRGRRVYWEDSGLPGRVESVYPSKSAPLQRVHSSGPFPPQPVQLLTKLGCVLSLSEPSMPTVPFHLPPACLGLVQPADSPARLPWPLATDASLLCVFIRFYAQDLYKYLSDFVAIACLLVCFPAKLWPSTAWELCLTHISILIRGFVRKQTEVFDEWAWDLCSWLWLCFLDWAQDKCPEPFLLMMSKPDL